MANNSQALDLEGIHREMHGITKQVKIMNEINACLVQHPAAPIREDADRSHRAYRSGDQDAIMNEINSLQNMHHWHIHEKCDPEVC